MEGDGARSPFKNIAIIKMRYGGYIGHGSHRSDWLLAFLFVFVEPQDLCKQGMRYGHSSGD